MTTGRYNASSWSDRWKLVEERTSLRPRGNQDDQQNYGQPATPTSERVADGMRWRDAFHL